MLDGCSSASTPDSSQLATGQASIIDYFIDCPTGTIEHFFDDGVFHWSDQVYRIHGYTRGDVVPTLEMGLSHIAPEDRGLVQDFWAQVTDLENPAEGPSSTYASILDAHGHTHQVILVAGLTHNDQVPVGAWALVVDITRSIHADQHRLADEAVAASALSRAVIEQAKGILMGRTGLNATEAFEHINRHSQHTNRKVVVIAQAIIDRAWELTHHDHHQPRAEAITDLFDAL